MRETTARSVTAITIRKPTMIRVYFALLFTLAVGTAGAEVYKCKGADGKTQFSDTACRAGSSATIVPDRAPLTAQQHEEAKQRARQQQDEALANDAGQSAASGAQPAADDRQVPAKKASHESEDAEAAARCIRDIERHGAPQNDKAEMIAACRTAGLVQRTSGISGDAVDNCVRSVERSGASEREKVRQLALCHGGDVQPKVIERRRPLSASPAQ